MTTRVDVEEIATTKGEKLLATVLTLFLLVGLLWVYFHIDVERGNDERFAAPAPAAADQRALRRFDRAENELVDARRLQSARRSTLSDRREAYRTKLDEGQRDATLQRRYETAQVAYQRAQRRRATASRELAAARPAANAAQSRLRATESRASARIDARQRHDSRVSVVLRLALLLACLGASYVLLGWTRRRRSRWLPSAMAAVAAVALLALVMAVDYLTDYIDVTQVGVLVLSIAGTLMTIAAFAALQRYLARRLPERRVRHRECPFCGFPVRDQAHCEGCGRDVVGACSACDEPRRVGTRHCRACGAA